MKPIDLARQGEQIARDIRTGEIVVRGDREGATCAEIVAETLQTLAYQLRLALERAERTKRRGQHA